MRSVQGELGGDSFNINPSTSINIFKTNWTVFIELIHSLTPTPPPIHHFMNRTTHFLLLISLLLLLICHLPRSHSQPTNEEDYDDDDDDDDLLLSAEIFDQEFLHQELTTEPIPTTPKPGTPEFDHPEITADSKPCMGARQAERNLEQAAAWSMPTPNIAMGRI